MSDNNVLVGNCPICGGCGGDCVCEPDDGDVTESLMRTILATAPDQGLVEIGMHPTETWRARGRWFKPERVFVGMGKTINGALESLYREIMTRTK